MDQGAMVSLGKKVHFPYNACVMSSLSNGNITSIAANFAQTEVDFISTSAHHAVLPSCGYASIENLSAVNSLIVLPPLLLLISLSYSN